MYSRLLHVGLSLFLTIAFLTPSAAQDKDKAMEWFTAD